MLLDFLQLKHASNEAALVRVRHDGADWAVDGTTGLVNSGVRRIMRDMTAATARLPPTVSANSGTQRGANNVAAAAPPVPNHAEANVIVNHAEADHSNHSGPSDASPKKIAKVIGAP